MRIVICTDTLGDLNGVSRFIQDMAELSLHFGIDLHVITSTAKQCPKARNIHNIKPIFRTKMPFYSELDLAFASRSKIEEKLLSLEPDLLHVSTPGPVGFIANGIAKRYRIPTLGTYHTDFPAYILDQTGSALLKKITDGVMRRFYAGFSHVFSRSSHYLDIMEHSIGIDPSRSSILRAGTNLERFTPSRKDRAVFERLNIPKAQHYLLYVGRISKEKNIPFLMRVWEAFLREHPEFDARLLLAGEGKLIEHYQAMASSRKVHFLGGIRDNALLSSLYASSDLFVFPSITDTLGQVVMEAQACALPCIVSDQGGPQSIVGYNAHHGGVIVRGNDTGAWVEAVADLLLDPQRRERLAQNGWDNMRHFNIKHSFEAFIDAHKRAYEHHASA